MLNIDENFQIQIDFFILFGVTELTVVVRSNDSFSVATSNNRGLLTFDNGSRG